MRLLKFALLFACMQLNGLLNAVDLKESVIRIEIFKGNEVIPYLPKLAELRLSFYREYPYLYEGSLAGEESYLSLYANSENSLLAVAKNGSEVVGAVSGIPLLESAGENIKLFAEKRISAEHLFYLGEIVVSQEYQKSDLQQKLYQQFEKAVIDLKGYDEIVVCEIERGLRDSQRPMAPFSSAVRWEERGFSRQPELRTYYLWKDIGHAEETDHLMVFWHKGL